MYSAIQSKFSDALAKQKLVFTQSTEVRKQLPSGVNVIYTLAPALGQKPPRPASEAASTAKPSSPWLPPDEDLVVKKLKNHTVVLNKFALAKYHFLLVTNEFEPQTAPLSEDDWEASLDLLRTVNKESGKRHVGFFNSGSKSGASISHKHIQFMTLPDDFRPFPDTTADVNPDRAVGDKRVPFANFVAGINPDAPAEDVILRYSDLLGKSITTATREHKGEGRPGINYNLVFTEEWLVVTPRSEEATSDGISINSLGTIGLLLAKSDKQLKILEEKGLATIEELGYPFEEVEELRPDHVGYTHY